jgi:hypothetical protein
MTAAQAREITKSFKKHLQDALYSIEVMANAGRNSAAWETTTFFDPELVANELINRGFRVELDEKHLVASW